MKKSKAVKELHKFLQQYDACKFRKKEATEILDFLTTNEIMLPPGVESISYKKLYGHDHDYDAIIYHEWEEE